jgi:hypothetical protein
VINRLGVFEQLAAGYVAAHPITLAAFGEVANTPRANVQRVVEANSEDRVKAVLDVFQSKLVRRGVSLKALDAGAPRPSGKHHKITAMSASNDSTVAGDP